MPLRATYIVLPPAQKVIPAEFATPTMTVRFPTYRMIVVRKLTGLVTT